MTNDVDIPWGKIEEIDRGYGSLCYVWLGRGNPTGSTIIRRLFSERVGVRQRGEVWMHLCERYGEPNRCVNPEHIRVGTRSENFAHHLSLRRSAGVPPVNSGRSPSPATREKLSHALRGREVSAATRTKISVAWKGKPKSAEHRARMSSAMRGRSLSDEWRGRIAKANSGTGNGRAKLTEEDVASIREQYADGGVTQATLAERYRVTPATIGKILRRVTWT